MAPTPQELPVHPARSALTVAATLVRPLPASPTEAEPRIKRECLDRGLVATTTPGGVFLTWHFPGSKVIGAGPSGMLGADFRVYLDGHPTATVTDSTTYLGPASTPTSQYGVAPIGGHRRAPTSPIHESFYDVHLYKGGGEERIPIVNQEPQPGDTLPPVHHQVAGLLHRPCSGRVCGHSGQVQSPGTTLDEDQHIQPFEQCRLDHQEVTRDDRVRLGGQELPPGRPGPARHRIDTGRMQDLPHRRGRDRVPQARQLTLNSPLPPDRILPRHPNDQRLDLPAGAGPSRAAPVGEGPLTHHKVTMPSKIAAGGTGNTSAHRR
ncbi:hypothetical protein [Nonomuraea turkmeniaca]|uniref:rhamnogalacturonan endolyase family protein n=1 Tax=Nonomuraea turkmeniaca TaxID=103838 RepID=UPI003CCC726D